MGEAKGKGAANLRRKNSERKERRSYEKLHAHLKANGFPDLSFEIKERYNAKDVK